jgi:fatty-acyl-CoA synthase
MGSGTREAIDAAGWMHTGDLATIDDEGLCRIVGRIKDMVIRGGANVYPREDRAVPVHSYVQVIGVPDQKYGEEVRAWIIPKRGARLGAEEVREFCKGRFTKSRATSGSSRDRPSRARCRNF